MNATKFFKQHVNPEVLEMLETKVWEQTLEELGLDEKNGKIFEFNGRLYANSETEALEKSGVKVLTFVPSKIDVYGQGEPIGDVDESSKLVIVEELLIVGSSYELLP